MSLFYQQVDRLEEKDLRGLIGNGVHESTTLDYKEVLPDRSGDDNYEFRSDVSSFANAAGGDIIYGMKEKRTEEGSPTGEPEDLVPLDVNPDEEILRLEQILQHYIDPRIPGVRVRFIKVNQGGYVGIVRVPKSWRGLHGVQMKESLRFYSRTSRGKYPLRVSEIQAGFVAAEAGYERLRRFRQERVSRIVANEGPVDVPEGPKVILHLLPFSMLDPTIEWDVEGVRLDHDFAPIGTTDTTHRYNFDGVVKFVSDNPSPSYVQFFRNGSVEACGCGSRFFDIENKLLSSVTLERELIASLRNYLRILSNVGISVPFALGLTLVGVRGVTFLINTIQWGHPAVTPFRESDLVVPEILITSYETPAHTILQRAFDRIWNAAGRSGSAYYDAAGKWIGK